MSPFQVSGSRRKVMNWDSHVHQLSNKHMQCANIKIMEDFAQMCGSLYFLRTTCRAVFFFFSTTDLQGNSSHYRHGYHPRPSHWALIWLVQSPPN